MGKEKLNLNVVEVVEFFKKYNVQELEVLNGILAYALDYDLEEEKAILACIHEEKMRECQSEFSVPIRSLNFWGKNELLNDRELAFLHDISNSAMLCLDSVKHINVENLYGLTSNIFDQTSEDIEDRVRLQLMPKKED